tara:strand:+ start:178 stop:357 length:180 start_codon:yes stop_codon:yes gene_type:complete
MFDVAHGLLFGVFGILITIVGFMIAYIVANKVAYEKKPKELSEVEKSLKEINAITSKDK